jgi:DNA-binding Lrp family transcriptional regulator
MPTGSMAPPATGSSNRAVPATAATVPRTHAEVRRSPVATREVRPAAGGATPSATTVASAAPARVTEVRKAAWNAPVDTAASSSHPIVGRRHGARTARLGRNGSAASSTAPPTSSRTAPSAMADAVLPARTWAGPTVPHNTAASSTGAAPQAVRRFLNPITTPHATHTCEKVIRMPNIIRSGVAYSGLDELDVALLRLLQNDARQTNRELAARAGVAPSTSLERVRSLVRRGVITGYRAEVDLGHLGRSVQALIAVRIRPPSRHTIEAFRDWVSGLPEVLGLFVTSGSEDFLIHVGVRDTDGLYAFVIDRLTERREVADVRTSVVYEHLRTRVVESPTVSI